MKQLIQNKSIVGILIVGICCLAMGLIVYFIVCLPNPNSNRDNIITLGSILSPAVSLFAAIMFYLAIAEQRAANIEQKEANNELRAANNIQQQSSDINVILKLYDYASLEFEEFIYEGTNGKSAFHSWIGNKIAVHDVNFLLDFIGFKFESIMAAFKIVLDAINSSNLNDSMRLLLKVKLYTRYVEKLGEGVTNLETHYRLAPDDLAIQKFNYVMNIHREISSLYKTF